MVKQGLSKNRILELAAHKGMFSVSMRWRDDTLRRKCFNLLKAGKLLGGKRHSDHYYFYPVRNIEHESGPDRGRAGGSNPHPARDKNQVEWDQGQDSVRPFELVSVSEETQQ